jgi:thiamine biosynthesis lipoprotein
MKEYYHSLNPFDSLSIISQVNQNKEIEVDSIFINAFQKSEQISELSDGMLDITCAPLINLWGFGFSKMDSVSPQIIDSLITFVGYKKVRLENKKVIKDDPRILLNFSTVGDGCICDLIADLFDKNGIENYLIEIGGEMSLKGVNKNGDPWRVAITKPVDDNFCRQEEIIYQILHIKERMGVATSGDYRNYYIKDGKKYAHTLNPKTGYPADQNILSATVLSKECITADGLATVIMSIGTRGIEMLKRRIPDLDYFIIYSDSVGSYKTEYSKGMEKYLSQ